MNKAAALLIALFALIAGGCFPWPAVHVQASQLELRVFYRGEPVPGVEVTRTVLASPAEKPAVQTAKTDGFGKCIFAAVRVQTYVHVVGEYNFVQRFAFSKDGRKFLGTQIYKPNYDDLGETTSFSVPPLGIKEIKRLENRIRVSLELDQLRAD